MIYIRICLKYFLFMKKRFLLLDKLCNLDNVPHGGIVCDTTGSTYRNCRVVCEPGYVVNPIRAFRRKFNCMHPDDVEALNVAMNTQKPCLSK